MSNGRVGDGARTEVLVVGAGLGGLALARSLNQKGVGVRVLDKSRGVSGRAATRRTPAPAEMPARLDHGARFFTARHPRTVELAEGGVRAGWNRVWAQGFPTWQNGEVRGPSAAGHPRYVPPQGMSTLGRELARGLDVATEHEITSVERRPGGWRLHARDGVVGEAARLVLNLPAPQARALLEGAVLEDRGLSRPDRAALEEAAALLGRVRYAPCWAVGVVLERDLQATWPALSVEGHAALDWIAREHTKRSAGHPPALMLHASAPWSRDHLERRAEEVLPELLGAAREVLGEDPAVAQAFAHRWRYSVPERRAPGPYFWNAELGLGLCGDSFTPDDHGPRVEAALLSGWALATRLAEHD
ncbi:NAD(P)/FAD-dependent oxidoreductase [Deinococcus aerophilus]|uniref:Amine oxidase domain-containing protein n=1 Tax=Deinococcus aerophilus TaxID=522488 RepID=A0ABQ2GYY1_9DEIO|nr:FAD-dependent oxidoreductase [Deinococcus aerophilus]GGM20708.1 hypothetical protein GCM10010841_30890 [Deinococcus aerophilus]